MRVAKKNNFQNQCKAKHTIKKGKFLQRSFYIIVVSALLCTLVGGFANTGFAAQSSTYGDANGDGSIDAIDFAIIKRAVLSTLTETVENAKYIDLNADNNIDSIDLALIKQFLLGKISKFPADKTGEMYSSWDWNGIVGTGQSLSVGSDAGPTITTTQPYNNLKLSLENETIPPWNDKNSKLKMVPLIEPIRQYGFYYGGAYPGNIFGETPHSAMGNQITALTRANFLQDFITVHTAVGETGQGIDALSKGAAPTTYSGRAYDATLFEAKAIKRLAQEQGKSYGVGAVIMTHGERDAGNTNYGAQLRTLLSDYNKDISEITGQTQKFPMLLVQQQSCGTSGVASVIQTQWRMGVDYPSEFVCVGPNYQNAYAADGVHLTAQGYRQLGELYGKVYYERIIRGNDWNPLQPILATRNENVVTVYFNVPVKPLVWDTKLPEPNQGSSEWKNGKGFEVRTSTQKIAINSVEINSDYSVKITCANNLPASDLKVGYAFYGSGTKREGGTYRWGLLRDSDPFKGSSSGNEIPNYCVSFEMDVK